MRKKKIVPSEKILQKRLAKYLDDRHLLWFHPANEAPVTKSQAYLLKLQGLKAGVPDFMILEPNQTYHGLAIELKSHYGTPSEKQIKWLLSLSDRGWCARWVNSEVSFINLVNQYLNDETISIAKRKSPLYYRNEVLPDYIPIERDV